MTDRRDCEQVRPLLAELATGAAAGAERAGALQHVVDCEACRQELAQLARTADELLLLAPEREPPAGFESRVLARLRQQPSPPAAPARRRRGLVTAVAATMAMLLAAGLGLGAGAGATWQATENDRRVAEQYRQTLGVAGGRYLAAMPITASSGARTGTAFLYQGEPSWILVTITGAPADGRYEMLVVGRDGVVHPGGSCEVRDGDATAGYRLYRPVSDVAAIQLNGPGGVRLSARR